MPSLLCIGMGYTARVLTPMLVAKGWQVHGTGRQHAHIPYVAGNPTAPLYEAIAKASHVLISVPPMAEGCPVFADIKQHIREDGWIGYLSTTGVYGDYAGAWVNETSETRTTEPRSLARLKAERQWQSSGAMIFRLSGIYGVGRSALDSVRDGSACCIDAPGHVFSRMHVEDIARTLMCAMETHHYGEIYNVADDEPSAASEVVEYACQLLDVLPPASVPLAEAMLSPMMKSFYSASRRVSNQKIKETWGITLRYPTYREGLQAILAQELANGTTLA